MWLGSPCRRRPKRSRLQPAPRARRSASSAISASTSSRATAAAGGRRCERRSSRLAVGLRAQRADVSRADLRHVEPPRSGRLSRRGCPCLVGPRTPRTGRRRWRASRVGPVASGDGDPAGDVVPRAARPAPTAASSAAPRTLATTGSATWRIGRPSTSAMIWHHSVGPRAAPDERQRVQAPLGELLDRLLHPARLRATPSSTARTSCARVVSRRRLNQPPRTRWSSTGVRSPFSHGAKITPSLPGGADAAVGRAARRVAGSEQGVA